MADHAQKKPLLTLCFLVFLDLVGFGILLPLQTPYAIHFRATPTQITVLMGIYSLTQFIFAPFWGRMSDRHGRRIVLILSQCTSVLSYLMMAFAQSFHVLMIARVVSGLAAGNISAAFAYAADVTSREQRAKGMGMLGASIGMGFVLGPFIGAMSAVWAGWIAPAGAHRFDLILPCLVAALLSGLALIGVLFLLPESLNPANRRRRGEERGWIGPIGRFLNHPQALPTLGVMFLMTVAFSIVELTFALLLYRKFGYQVRGAGVMMGLLGFISAFTQGGLVRRIVPRWGEPRTIGAGAFLMIIGIMMLPYLHTIGWFTLATSVMAVGAGLMNPTLSSHLSKICNPQEYGSAMGIGQSLSSLGRATPFWLAGYLFERYGLPAPYLLASCMVGLCLVVSLRLRKVE